MTIHRICIKNIRKYTKYACVFLQTSLGDPLIRIQTALSLNFKRAIINNAFFGLEIQFNSGTMGEDIRFGCWKKKSKGTVIYFIIIL